jgi:TonB family protein
MINCSKCGLENTENGKKCFYCKQEVAYNPNLPNLHVKVVNAKQSRLIKKKIFFIGLWVLAIIATSLYLTQKLSSNDLVAEKSSKIHNSIEQEPNANNIVKERKANTIESESEHKKYFDDQMQAEFPGGMDELSMFFSENLVYPEEEKDGNVQGKVEVEFVIDENGAVSKYKVIKSAGKNFDAEALRVLAKMPKWKPAIQNGRKVSMYYTLPVNFTLEDEE